MLSIDTKVDVNPKYIISLLENNLNFFTPNLMTQFSTLEVYLRSKNVFFTPVIDSRLAAIRGSCLNLETLPAEILANIFCYLSLKEKKDLSNTNKFMRYTLLNLSLCVKVPNTNFQDLLQFVKYYGHNEKVLDLRSFSYLSAKELKTLEKHYRKGSFHIDFKMLYTHTTSIPVEGKSTFKALNNRVSEIDVNIDSGHAQGAYFEQVLQIAPDCKFNLNYNIVKYSNTESKVLANSQAFNQVVLGKTNSNTQTLAEFLIRVESFTAKFSGKIHFIAPRLDFFGSAEAAEEFFKENGKHFVGVQIELSDQPEFNARLNEILSHVKHVSALSLVCPLEVTLDVSTAPLDKFNNLRDLELKGCAFLPSQSVLERCTKISFDDCVDIEAFVPENLPNLRSLKFNSGGTLTKFPSKIERIEIDTCSTLPFDLNLMGYKNLTYVKISGDKLTQMLIFNCPSLSYVNAQTSHNDFVMKVDSCENLKEISSNKIQNITVTHSNPTVSIEETIDLNAQ
ncbi:MAG: hypothetical protein WC222_00335 [Parachlamydiales bacterium]|jgi:hypothetical protein